MNSPTESHRSHFAAALAGAVTAAVFVGLGEAALVMFERHLGVDTGLLFFAVLFYGVAGLAIGIAGGLGLTVLGRLWSRLGASEAYAASGAAVFAALVVVIGRFRIFRDVFHETFDHQVVSPRTFQLASLAALAVLFVMTFVALRALARRSRIATAPTLVLGACVAALALAGAGMTLVSPADDTRVEESTAGGAGAIATGAAALAGPSIILILVDTLRADHLSCYGYEAIKTPAIDALAADGTRFARAYAQASWTRPSVATILTSLYPSSHQAVHKSDVLPDAVITLPEVLQAVGYRTVGFADNINIAPLFNFDQGFDEYVFLEPEFFFGATESAAQLTIYNQLRLVRERYLSDTKHVENYYQPAEVVTQRGLDWIARHGEKPFFMMIHYMDPHDPYFTHPYDGTALARVANPNPDPALAERYRTAYDGEIRYLDSHLGRFLDDLKARGIYDQSLIVLTADHGEEFCEHGGWWHGLTLYEEQIAVPLIVKRPRGTATGVVNPSLVSSLDITPTILTAIGVRMPETMQGRALGLDPGAGGPRDHAFAEQDLEGNILHAYRTEEWKLIDANPGNPRGLPPRQLFEVTRDPHEQHDLAASREDQAAALAASVEALRTHAQTIAVQGVATDIDPATKARLRELGYVH